jgi:hypothetical protein
LGSGVSGARRGPPSLVPPPPPPPPPPAPAATVDLGDAFTAGLSSKAAPQAPPSSGGGMGGIPAGVYLSGLSASVSPPSLLVELARALPSMGDLAAGSVGVRRVAGEAALLVHPAFASGELLRRLAAELGHGCAVPSAAGPVRVQLARQALRRIADDAASASATADRAGAAAAPVADASAPNEAQPGGPPEDDTAPAAPGRRPKTKRGGRPPKAKRGRKAVEAT